MFVKNLPAFFATFTLLIRGSIHRVEYELNLYCLPNPNSHNLCMSVDIIYPEYNDSVESVSLIRGLLLDSTKDPWVQIIGDDTWVELEKIGTIFRNTRPVTPFEAIRAGSAPGSAYELFRTCRSADCKFLASNSKVPEYLGADKKPRDTHHVSKFAFDEKTAAAAPVIAVPGPVEVVRVMTTPKKYIAGLVVVAMVILLRLKQVLASVDLAKTVSETTTFVLHGVIGVDVSGISATESGLMGGMTEFYWDDHPQGAVWLTRLLFYGGIVWFFDLHYTVYEWHKARRAYRKPITPVAPIRRKSGTSEPASDYDEVCCNANNVYMALPSKTTPLCPTPCKDMDCEIVPILREDHAASKLSAVFLTDGIHLCSTHRDIYHTLRSNQACAVLQCMRLGVSGPDGKNYCPDHMVSAVLPPPVAPTVKFEPMPKLEKVPENGMGNIPDQVLGALANRMHDVEGLSEPEIANRLTDDYGGDLLTNALRIYHLFGERSSSPKDDRWGGSADPPSQETVKANAVGVPREKCYSFDPVESVASQIKPRERPHVAAIPAHTQNFNAVPVGPAQTPGPVSSATQLFPPPILTSVPPVVAPSPPGVAQVQPSAHHTNVFGNTPYQPVGTNVGVFGVSDAITPVPDGGDSNKLMSSIAYSIDRIANPDISTKPGTLESIKRNEEIWVFVARFFNNYHVSLCPGVTGKH